MAAGHTGVRVRELGTSLSRRRAARARVTAARDSPRRARGVHMGGCQTFETVLRQVYTLPSPPFRGSHAHKNVLYLSLFPFSRMSQFFCRYDRASLIATPRRRVPARETSSASNAPRRRSLCLSSAVSQTIVGLPISRSSASLRFENQHARFLRLP